MKRYAVLTTFLVMIGLASVAPPLFAARQSEPIAGVGGGAIGQGSPAVGPGHTLSLRRAVFEPDGYVSTHHHPGPLVLFVETGELSYGPIVEGRVEVVRGEIYAAGEGTVTPTEPLGPGDETVLRSGDWLYEDGGVVHEAHNAGSEPAVVWLSALWANDEPGTIFHEEVALRTHSH
jgi:quercetin dioxygenase-like cupin family protein